jgi:thioredoxin reductase (NADPH)
MEKFDFAIIGAGGTGLAAAMYAARLNLKTIVFAHAGGTELPIGGVITTTKIVENYPGFTKTSGLYLSKQIADHAKSYDLVKIKEEKVIEVNKKGEIFLINTGKENYEAKAILFATGTKRKKLEVPGAKEFEGKGIGYCSLCDAPLYKDKVVAVVGGADTAAVEALILSEYAKKIFIIHRRDKIHPEPINLERIKKNKKIEVINNACVLEIKGDKVLRSVVLDNAYKGSKELKLDGLYVSIGHIANSDVAKKLGVKLNEKGEIIINHKNAETNVPGVFAAGDVTDKHFKQLIIGVADGCTAAYSAFEYMQKSNAKKQ